MCTNCKKPYYISTAIAYTSGKPHIGNTYEIVLADAIARYKREQMITMRNRSRRSSRNYMIRAISIKDIMRDFTAHRVSPSGLRPRSLTENARTADARYSRQRKRHISSV